MGKIDSKRCCIKISSLTDLVLYLNRHLGSDIDFLMLHGKTRPSRISQKVRETDESVLANLKQYNLSHLYLDVLISDFSNSVWSSNIYFDAIITDREYMLFSLLPYWLFKVFSLTFKQKTFNQIHVRE